MKVKMNGHAQIFQHNYKQFRKTACTTVHELVQQYVNFLFKK